MEENPIVIESSEAIEKKPLKRSILLIILFSLFCPGLGHIYSGNLKRGVIVYFLFIFASILLLFLELVFSPLLIVLSLFLYLFVILDGVKQTKRNNIYELKPFNKWFVYILILFVSSFLLSPLIVTPIIKSTVTEAYLIPTGAMENTLFVGDYVLANKCSYGLHVPYSDKYLLKYKSPKRGDLCIYSITELNKQEILVDTKYIKRCIGLPGDTLQIQSKALYCNGTLYPNPANVKFITRVLPVDYEQQHIFPKGYKWNQDSYGPLYIPKEGDMINVNKDNYEIWKQVIELDGHKIEKKSDGTIYVDDKLINNGNYKVENNYYFVLGDNRDISIDSRYTGFIREDKIVGKVSSIYWSWDTSIPLSRYIHRIFSIRWSRIGTSIE